MIWRDLSWEEMLKPEDKKTSYTGIKVFRQKAKEVSRLFKTEKLVRLQNGKEDRVAKSNTSSVICLKQDFFFP